MALERWPTSTYSPPIDVFGYPGHLAAKASACATPSTKEPRKRRGSHNRVDCTTRAWGSLIFVGYADASGDLEHG